MGCLIYDGGGNFLNALYRNCLNVRLSGTVKHSEILVMFPEINRCRTCSLVLFSQNYDTWIGEPEETLAWNYLGKTRKFLAEYETGKAAPPSEDALQQAFQYMYFAEGSDWFWWYGADQDSGNDSYFDEGFRSLLAKVYESLDEPVPTYVKVPIIAKSVVATSQEFTAALTPTIDGSASAGEWDTAAFYPFLGGVQASADNVASGFYYGVDSKNMYLRMDGISSWSSLADGVVGFYIAAPQSEKSNAITRLSVDSEDPFLLGFNATHLVEVDLATDIGSLYNATSTTWITGEGEITVAKAGLTV